VLHCDSAVLETGVLAHLVLLHPCAACLRLSGGSVGLQAERTLTSSYATIYEF
jgi:hypothetical protein